MNDGTRRLFSLARDRASLASARPLPLAGPGRAGERADGVVSEAAIRALVDSFYDEVRRDDLLGQVFTRHIVDWSLHLPKMHDFWSAVARRTGRYAGRPLEVHRAIPDLSPAHFDRWLALWEATVSRVLATSGLATREKFVVAARRMAALMSARLPGASGGVATISGDILAAPGDFSCHRAGSPRDRARPGPRCNNHGP